MKKKSFLSNSMSLKLTTVGFEIVVALIQDEGMIRL